MTKDLSLDQLLEQADASEDTTFGLEHNIRNQIKSICDPPCLRSESRGVLAVTCTLLLKKVRDPSQDIRLHMAKIPGGFSGRSLDTDEVTPFLKREGFPSMMQSGWTTRSLEQSHPYDKNYPGPITPTELKEWFLQLLDDVQKSVCARACLLFLLRYLSDCRETRGQIELVKPQGRMITDTVKLIESHWNSKNFGSTSKLPTIAIYSAYSCLIREVKRYSGCKLQDLLSHTSADARTQRVGDVDVRSSDGKPFEAVEIKHHTPIDFPMIENLRDKISSAGVKVYYILSTKESIPLEDIPKITASQLSLKERYGCHLIVNGVASTLKYYLRLLTNSDLFINEYVDRFKNDNEISYELERQWNKLVK